MGGAGLGRGPLDADGGGMTGDALGSSVELGELSTLVAAAALMHLRVI